MKAHIAKLTNLLFLIAFMAACGVSKKGETRTQVKSQIAQVGESDTDSLSIAVYSSKGEGMQDIDTASSDVVAFGLSSRKGCKCPEIWGDHDLGKLCYNGNTLYCDKDKKMAFQFQPNFVVCWGGKKSHCNYEKLKKASKK
jgi:hypothetical protein